LAPLWPSSARAFKRLSVIEKKAISAPEKKAESPKQIRTAIKSIDGLTSSGGAEERIGSAESCKVSRAGFVRE
jgi:hypothetical protein